MKKTNDPNHVFDGTSGTIPSLTTYTPTKNGEFVVTTTTDTLSNFQINGDFIVQPVFGDFYSYYYHTVDEGKQDQLAQEYKKYKELKHERISK